MAFYRITCFLLILCFSCCKFSAPTSAQEIYYLHSVLHDVIENHPELEAKRSDLGISETEMLAEGVIDNPFFKFVVAPEQMNYRFQIGKDFVHPGVPKYERLVVLSEHKINIIQYTAKLLEFRDKVRNSYAILYVRKKEIDLYNEILCIMQDLLKEIQDKKPDEKEILNAEVFIIKIKNELERANNSYMDAKMEFQELTGKRLPELYKLKTPVESKDLFKKMIPDNLLQYALEHNPDILENQMQIQRARYEKSLAKANVFPLITLIAGYDLHLDSARSSFRLDGNIELPIFDREQGEILNAIVQINHFQENETRIKKQVMKETLDTYEKLVNYQESVNIYEKSHLPVIQKLIKTSYSSLMGCKTSVSDFISTLQVYIDINQNYFQAIKNFQDSMGDLEKLIGLGYK